MTSPYGQHHDSAQSFIAADPHLPYRPPSQRQQARKAGPQPLFAPQQNHVRGFRPSPVEPIPHIDNVTASSEHAFAGRDDRSKRPFRPPLGVHVVPRSPIMSRGEQQDGRRHPPSPLRPEDINEGVPRSAYKLRSSKSFGDGTQWPSRRSSRPGVMPSPALSSRTSSDSTANPAFMFGEVRASMRSAVTGASSRINSGSINTDHSSHLTDDSSISDVEDSSAWPHDKKRSSFDVEDAIGLYEDGFESARESLEVDRRKLSLDIRPTSQQRSSRPKYSHRRSQSASILDRVSQALPDMRTSRVVSATIIAPPPPPPPPGAPVPRDRYGFKKASHHVTVEEYDAWDRSYEGHIARRRKKWNSLMKSYGLSTEDPIRFPPKSDKIKRYVRKGIPPEWRGAAWFWYAGGPGIMKSQPGLYERLTREVEEGKLTDNDREHIERDLHRTFPDNLAFKPESSPDHVYVDGTGGEPEVSIVQALRRVLQAFAVHNPAIGYCQSLNFIAGLLLLFLHEDEEKSFILLNLITSVHLPGTHGVTLEGANIDIAVLMSCIKDSLPNVWAKLDDKAEVPSLPPVAQALRLPTVSLATTAWFMSLFVGTLPMEGVLRTWDCLFFEGSKTLFRIALAIFKAGEKQIVSVDDPMEIFQVVQTIPRSMLDVNGLLEVCFRRRGGFGYLSQDVIEKRRDERRKQVKAGLGGEQGMNKWKTRWRSKTMKD